MDDDRQYEQDVALRDVRDEDIASFYENQADPSALDLAALPSRSWEDFHRHWSKIRSDPTVRIQTIVVDGTAAGNILTFERDGHREVGYWIARRFWGRGIATRALSAFLKMITARPLYAHTAKQNAASARVLEKCGFQKVGENKEFSTIGERTIEGDIFELR